MITAVLGNASQMMTAARLLAKGIEVTFADGVCGIVPYKSMKDIEGPGAIKGIELPEPYQIRLFGVDVEFGEIPWDFARYHCDPSYREQVKLRALEDSKVIGARIRDLRKAAGVTQASLADAAGISRDILSRLEKGEYPATFRTFDAIAGALEMSVWDLYRDPNAAVFEAKERVPNEVKRIENDSWVTLSEHFQDQFEALDEASNGIYLGLARVMEGFNILKADPANEPQVALIEDGLNVSARILKNIRAARVLCEAGYSEQVEALARSALEHVVVAISLPLNDGVSKTLHSGKEFNHSKLVREVIDVVHPELKFGELWDDAYPKLNAQVHPSGTWTQQLLLHDGEKGYSFNMLSSANLEHAHQRIALLSGLLKYLTGIVTAMARAVRMEWASEDVYQLLRRSVSLHDVEASV